MMVKHERLIESGILFWMISLLLDSMGADWSRNQIIDHTLVGGLLIILGCYYTPLKSKQAKGGKK